MGVDVAPTFGQQADHPNTWPPHDTDEAVFPRSWRPVDLTAVLDGTWERPQPTVGRRNDGVGMFYPGKSHTVVSETEGGKTWFALCAVMDEINAGHHVLYCDFEDDEGGIVGRLLTLGAHREVVRERFHYLRPDEQLGTGLHLDDLTTTLADHRPTLAVIDGVTEAMTLHGLNPLDNADVARFGRMLVRRITATGAAVASLDHVVKDREGRGRYALGGVHKLNGLDGASYLLENRTPFGVGVTGKSTVKIAKDRPGQLRRHSLPSSGNLHWYGDLVMQSHAEEFAEVSVEPPRERDEHFRPTVLMGRVSDALGGAPEPLSLRGILDRVRGKRQEDVRTAVAALVDSGHVTTQAGTRGAVMHTLVQPFPGEGEA